MASMKFAVFLLCCVQLLNILVGADDSVSNLSPQKAMLFKLHNEFRKKVASGGLRSQPKTNALRPLKWDKDLAAEAQKSAEECKFRYRNDRALPNAKYGTIGQNGAFAQFVDVGFSVWTHQSRNYIYANNTCKEECSNYLQLVSAETEAVGCGVARCLDMANYIVCNYGPRGDLGNKRPY